jgi:hypothetical protein
MARVSVRIGWGKKSLTLSILTAVHFAMGVFLGRAGFPELRYVLGASAALCFFFAIVHPHRVLELDDDDPPDRKVGDIIDD